MITDTQQSVPTQHAEVPHTLVEAAPRALRLIDQLGLWGNLGVSLLGFTGAIFVLVPIAEPGMSLGAAVVALRRRHRARHARRRGRRGAGRAHRRAVDGAAARAVRHPAVVPADGAQRRPAARLDDVRTGHDRHRDAPDRRRRFRAGPTSLAGGVHHHGARAAPARLDPGAAQVRHASPCSSRWSTCSCSCCATRCPRSAHGSWNGFWIAVDTVIGVSVSWVPLASDYSRHARSAREAFTGAFVGYSITQIACYALGLVALVTVAHARPEPDLRLVHGRPARHARLRGHRDPRTRPVLRRHLLDRGVGAELPAALGPARARARRRRDRDGLRAGAEHQRLRELPDPDRSVFVPAARRAGRRLLRDLARRSGTSARTCATRWATLVPWALGFVRLPARQPRLHLVVDAVRGRDVQSWLHFTPPDLDERVADSPSPWPPLRDVAGRTAAVVRGMPVC